MFKFMFPSKSVAGFLVLLNEIMIGPSRNMCYVLYLVSSILTGLVFRTFKITSYRKYIFSLIGLLQILVFCTFDSLHFFIMIGVSIIIIKSIYMYKPQVVFIFCFGYRIFFTTMTHLSLPRDENNLANALMLVCTLKMILVAYEVSDFRNRQNTDTNEVDKELLIEREPSMIDLLCYMTCFIGVFTGPIFKYRTYDDMLRTPYRPIGKLAKGRVYQIIICFIFLILGAKFVDMNYFYNDKCFEDALLIRALHVIPVGYVHVFRYVSVWLLAEVVCLLIGLGLYPSTMKSMSGNGPRTINEETRRHLELLKSEKEDVNVEYDYQTISNVNLKVITEVLFWKSIRDWNSTVQWWLAHFIYRSNVFPARWRGIRVLTTLSMSCIWHGMKPGYWICFCSAPCFAALEMLFLRTIRSRISGKWALIVYDCFHWWFMKMSIFLNCFILFTTLDYERIAFFFKSTYFVMYWMPLLWLPLCSVAFILPRQTRKKQE